MNAARNLAKGVTKQRVPLLWDTAMNTTSGPSVVLVLARARRSVGAVSESKGNGGSC